MQFISMKENRFYAALIVLALGLASLLAPPAMAQNRSGNYTTQIVATDNGSAHRIGNPQAEAQLIEFASYTCPFCAVFTREGQDIVRHIYVQTGKVSLEIRHLIFSQIDLTAAMLAHCGEPSQFPDNHRAIMLAQKDWYIGKDPTDAQRARWRFGPGHQRRRAIAQDYELYKVMERRGYERPQLDRCLKDEAKAQSLQAASNAIFENFGVQAVPNFILNGELLENVSQWKELQPRLDAFFR
jgi:protein-disulfide isomerase